MTVRLIGLTDDEWDIVVDTIVAVAAADRRNEKFDSSDILTRVSDKIEHQHQKQREMFADPALFGPETG